MRQQKSCFLLFFHFCLAGSEYYLKKGSINMTINIKSNGLTRTEHEFLYGNTKAKNHIDERYYFHITPRMKEIFADHAEIQPLTVFRERSNIAFDIVTEDNCPKRKLDQKEFDAFSDKDKSSGGIFLRALRSSIVIVIVFVVFLVFWIATIKSAIESHVLLYTSLFPIIGTFLLIIFLRASIKQLRSQQVTSDSEASFGNAVFFYDDPATGGIEASSESLYYIDVAFYDEKKLVKRVNCSRKVFDMLSQDSDVVVYNGNVYAYSKDGKLVIE